MNIDPRMIKIFILTIISMMLLCLAAILTKAKAVEYTGTYATPFIRGMWTSCYNAALTRRIPPAASAVYCDCVTDIIRERHTREETDNMTDKVQVFTQYAGECSMKLFGPSLIPPAKELTQASISNGLGA